MSDSTSLLIVERLIAASNYAGATAELERALADDPESAQLHAVMAWVLLR